MGIHPGAQGREFVPSTLDKIKELKKISGNVIISVDGGIKLGKALECVKAEADWIVIGSAILNTSHPEEALEAFRREIEP
jgi:ribulose-phosphate 3-epimerase